MMYVADPCSNALSDSVYTCIAVQSDSSLVTSVHDGGRAILLCYAPPPRLAPQLCGKGSRSFAGQKCDCIVCCIPLFEARRVGAGTAPWAHQLSEQLNPVAVQVVEIALVDSCRDYAEGTENSSVCTLQSPICPRAPVSVWSFSCLRSVLQGPSLEWPPCNSQFRSA